MGGTLGSDLETVVARALGVAHDDVSDDLGYGDIPEWDSLRHVGLMLLLEDEFGIEIGQGAASRLVSVAAIRDFVTGVPLDTHGTQAPSAASAERTNPELDGVTMARTEISEVDAENSQLHLRGYPVADLANRCSFEETAYCLLYGDLPGPQQLQQFADVLTEERKLSGEGVAVLEAHRRDSVAGALAAALAGEATWGRFDTFEEQALALLGKLPSIVAAHAALAGGRPVPEPNVEIGHAANALFVLRGKAAEPAEVAAIDALFVTQAEHGLAASTLAARVATSVNADVRPAISAATSTWFGDLHAGAVTRAMEIQSLVTGRRDARDLAHRWRAGRGRPYGFGHPVYRGDDPRSEVLRRVAEQLSEALGNLEPLQQADLLVEAVTEEWRGALAPNFDAYAATIYRLLGVPASHAVGLFTCARIAGWLAHVAEQRSNNHLIRPRLQYGGPAPRGVPDRSAM